MKKQQASTTTTVKEYSPLAVAAGIGSMLGSGCIVGLSATIPVWQKGLELTTGQVGIVSGGQSLSDRCLPDRYEKHLA